ncbi:MAG: FtsX-like permease family protein [Polyangiaceae bacterium]|nr:FtsX-like permease family protein [Polyangiaceae bacterium]
MNLATLAARNVLRNKLRSVLTVLGVAVAILAFVLLRTVIWSWTVAAEYAAKDRVATRHKITFINPLPLRYKSQIEQVPGVSEVTWATWFGAKHPTRDQEFFQSIAVDPKSFLSVYSEVIVPAEQREKWLGNRQGALVGESLAKQMGWKVGDRITLTGTIYPGDWQFDVDGIYTVKRSSLDKATLWMHWDYLNDSVSPRQKDQAGWYLSRIKNAGDAATVAKRIDALFDSQDQQTLSMDEHAMNASFLGMFSAILKAIDVVSVVILLIMMLILGNTIAMGVRERTNEYGMLRAVGFLPKHIGAFVLLEAVVVGLLGGILGLIFAYPVVEKGVGRFLEENMGAMFPYFHMDASVAALALLLSVALGFLAALVPAYRAMQLNVVDSLRRVG